MNRARVYVFATMGIVVLASLSLWLVPGAVRQAFRTPEADAVPLSMTRAQADAQVDSAVYALGEGMISGEVEQALSGCDTGDAEWLAERRRAVEEVHARLVGHPVRVLRTRGYWVLRPGKSDEVGSSLYGGALAIYDSLAKEIVHAEPYRAQARGGRFRLLPPATDDESRIYFRLSLGSLYWKELGMTGKTLEIWRKIPEDFPQAKDEQRQWVYQEIAELLEEQGDFAAAGAAYEQALGLTGEISYKPVEFHGKWVSVRLSEWVKYKLAQCALRTGQKDKARKWCEELAGSKSEELAGAARRMMAEL